ncbi:hypothetical protein EDD15DRAFT_2199072 [Pisolithus albus]|nr:hypothetical protein EDD15DRAFT_2199072 [Pisolithus albus]
MPAAQKRRRVRAWKAKMGEKPTEVEIEDSLRLRRGIGPVIDTDSRVEPIAFYGAAKVHCGQATTVTGVNRTESTVVKTKCYYRCFQRKGVWDSGVFPPILVDTMDPSSHLAWRNCVRLWVSLLSAFCSPSLRRWMLEEGIADGLELRVHMRTLEILITLADHATPVCISHVPLSVGCSSRETVGYAVAIRESQPDTTAHRYQDFKDRAVAIVESLGQEAIRGSTPIAVHGVQLSPPATPAVPHFSRGYDPKRLLIVLQSPYEPVKASISSKSSKGRKGSMNQGWIQRRVFYYPSTSGTCIRREICPTGRL